MNLCVDCFCLEVAMRNSLMEQKICKFSLNGSINWFSPLSNCSFLSLILICTCGFSSIYFLSPTPVPFKYRFLLFTYTTLLPLHFIFTYVNLIIFRFSFQDVLLFSYELDYALRPTKNGFDLCCLVIKFIPGIISYKF